MPDRDATDDDAIAAEILALARARGARRTLCPSEVARALATDWRPLMPEIRRVAGRLVAEGALVATQRGTRIDPVSARGPIRLGLPPGG